MTKENQRSQKLVDRFLRANGNKTIASFLLGMVCGLVLFWMAFLQFHQGHREAAVVFSMAGFLGFYPFILELMVLHFKQKIHEKHHVVGLKSKA